MLPEERSDLDRISLDPTGRLLLLLTRPHDVELRRNSDLPMVQQCLQMSTCPLIVALQDLHQKLLGRREGMLTPNRSLWWQALDKRPHSST